MNSIRSTERQMRNLQKQRHLYDIKMMVMSNPMFKNLGERDQKKLVKLIYKAEMMEIYMRDKQIIRINDDFEGIVQGVTDMLNQALSPEEDEDEL